MVKRFNAPEPEEAPTPEPTGSDPVFSRGSAFSPFDNPVTERKKILGERLLSVTEPDEEIPDSTINDEFEKFEAVFDRAGKEGATEMLALVKAYRLGTSSKQGGEQAAKRRMVKLYRDMQKTMTSDDLDAILLSFIGNLSFLMAKMGR